MYILYVRFLYSEVFIKILAYFKSGDMENCISNQGCTYRRYKISCLIFNISAFYPYIEVRAEFPYSHKSLERYSFPYMVMHLAVTTSIRARGSSLSNRSVIVAIKNIIIFLLLQTSTNAYVYFTSNKRTITLPTLLLITPNNNITTVHNIKCLLPTTWNFDIYS